MLGTIREFGLERLSMGGELTAAQQALAAVVLDLAETAQVQLWTAEQRQWMDRLETDYGNIQAVMDWAADQAGAETELSLRLGDALWLYWQLRNRVKEGRARLDAALGEGEGPQWERAAALNVAGFLAWIQQDDQRAQAMLVEAREIWDHLENKLGAARSRLFLAFVAWRRGAFLQMAALVPDALRLFRGWEGWDEKLGTAVCLVLLGMMAHMHGDGALAKEQLDEALRLVQEIGSPWGIAAMHYYVAEFARDGDDVAQAAKHYADALNIVGSQADKWSAAAVVAGIATISQASGLEISAAHLVARRLAEE